MKVLSRMDVMVKLKEKIYSAKQSHDRELVNRLEKLLQEVMRSNSGSAI